MNELLAHERAGVPIEIFSLKQPKQEPVHKAIESLQASITYMPVYDNAKIDYNDHFAKRAANLLGLKTRFEDCDDWKAQEIYWAVQTARMLLTKKINHLHAHFATSAVSVARLSATLAGISYSFTAHARDIFLNTVNTRVLRHKISDAAAVVTVSQFNLQYLRDEFNTPKGKTELIYNGLDLTCHPFKAARGRRPFILAVGRLVEKKGFKTLIEAFSPLSHRFPDLHCEIVGTGPLEAELRAQILSQGLSDRINLAGALPQEEVRKLIQEAAILVAPCIVATDGDRDGLPTILLESMALGTPCISTDVTGIPEVLHHEKTGLIVPQNQPDALQSACVRILSDERFGLDLALRARQLIEADFNIVQNSAQLRRLFHRVASV